MTLTATARQALQLMDLTSLNQNDTPATISALCESAQTPFGVPAAICVFPEMIVWAKQELARLNLANVKVATVTNFPMGADDIERAVAETERAVAAGADEIDVVFPWRALTAGNTVLGLELVSACKQACGDKVQLKVIIESGELASEALIRQASEIAISGGADFIKTSTGKVPVNATLSAAKVMLEVIKERNPNCGFKAAGGVRTAAEASAYLELAAAIMGAEWVTAQHFRFGASSLLKNLTDTLQGLSVQNQEGY